MKTKCIIIDDEPLAINVIKNHLKEINDIELVNTFSNAIEALSYIKEHQIDLLFLDINMPLLDGLSFIKSLEKKPLIIITTAHSEFAVESYELDVLDYLIKPIPFPRFVQSINRVFRTKNTNQISNERPYIFVKLEKKKMRKIYLDEILVIESLKDYLKITTLTNKFVIHQTLSNFTEELPAKKFIRVHRSYTVAVDKIDTIEGNSIEVGGIRYAIGRTYIDTVKNAIFN